MFCPNCGTKNPDAAAFCGSCGTPLPTNPQQQAQAQPQPQPQPQPQQPVGAAAGTAPVPNAMPAPAGAAAPAAKGSLSKRAVLIGIIVVAVIVVVAIIVGVVTCSGGGKAPNLNNVVGDKAEQVAGSVEKLSSGKVGEMDGFSANDDMRSLMKKAYSAFGSEKKDMKEIKEDIQKTSPWAIGMRDSKGEALKLKDLKDGTDPSVAAYMTFRVLDKPKPEDIAKIASEAATFDKVVVGERDGDFSGMARNDKCVMFITGEEFEGVYKVNVVCYRLDEVDNDDNLEDAFNDMYDSYEDNEYDFDTAYRK